MQACAAGGIKAYILCLVALKHSTSVEGRRRCSGKDSPHTRFSSNGLWRCGGFLKDCAARQSVTATAGSARKGEIGKRRRHEAGSNGRKGGLPGDGEDSRFVANKRIIIIERNAVGETPPKLAKTALPTAQHAAAFAPRRTAHGMVPMRTRGRNAWPGRRFSVPYRVLQHYRTPKHCRHCHQQRLCYRLRAPSFLFHSTYSRCLLAWRRYSFLNDSA